MRVFVSIALVVLAIAFALWRGGRPERLMAAIFAGVLVTDRIAHLLVAPDSKAQIDLAHAGIDLSALAAMIALLLRTDRMWIVWACSLQILSVSAYAMRLIDVAMPRHIEKIMAIGPSYALSLVFLIGTWLNRRERPPHASTER